MLSVYGGDSVRDFVRRVVLSWFFAVFIEYIILPAGIRDLSGLEGLAAMSLFRVIGISAVCTALLFALGRFKRTANAERCGIAMVFAALATISLYASFSWAFFVLCILVEAALIAYALFGWNYSDVISVGQSKERKVFAWITAGLAVCFFLFLGICTVARIYSFSTPTYDFGIFAQMFYHMKESGLPLTTVERDGLLSHLHVHMSPIWYLLLPFYMLVPVPATLNVMQAAVMASAVIPLWKLGKRHGVSDAQRLIICTLLLLYPAFSGAAIHDIHENCFLTPLILWLFYGVDKKSIPIIAVSALLTLTVKEDAAVYVAMIALWLIVKTALHFDKSKRRELLAGVILLSSAILYFFIVTSFLANIGDGVMTYRYRNFMYDGSASLITVIKSVIISPMKTLFECVDTEKLYFIMMTLLPLLGLPLLTRRYERYILLIPYVLVNLMSDYVYQHDIFYQYTFGPTAFLIYLTLVNMADIKIDKKRLACLITAICVSAGCYGAVIVPKAIRYPAYCSKFSGFYQNLQDTLSVIPEDASVTSTTFYTTFLSQREVLYDIGYASKEHLLESEYVVLNVTAHSEYRKYSDSGMQNGLEKVVEILESNGYQPCAELDGVLIIYKKQ